MLTTPQLLATYLYLRQGEQMPEPIYDSESGEIDIAADDAALTAWSSGIDTYEADLTRLERFIVNTAQLLQNLELLVIDAAEPVAPQYMTLFYDAAKETFDHDKTLLRTYFSWLYLVLFQRNEGPRWGEFVAVYGVDEFNEMVRRRFNELF